MKTILIVDDETDIAATLKFIFSDEGYLVRIAYDGMEALELLKKEPLPNLIFSDLMMPKMNGYQLLKAIRDDQKLKSIPVILASAGKIDSQQLLNSNFDFFIRKPFDLSDLLATVENALNKKL